jgi:phosphoserine phosphatase
MNLVIQGADVETTALKELGKLSGASGIAQVAPNVFHLKDASPADGIAELCAREKLDWVFLPET